MKIAFVMGDCISGGVRTYLFNYLRTFEENNVSFDVFAYEGVSNRDRELVSQFGGRLIELPHISHPCQFVASAYSYLKNGGYDILHGMLNTLNPFVMLAGACAGVPIRISENLSTGHKNEGIRILAKVILRPFASLFATHIAANSKLASDWMFGKSNRSQIIKNPIDLEKYRYRGGHVRSCARSRLGLNGCFVFGWIGRYVPQKNPLFLLNILEEIILLDSTARLLMVGGGALEEDVRRLANEKQLNDYIVELGITNDIAPAFEAMDCFVMPSLYEGLPVVGLEAQASGLPCVFSTEITQEVMVNPNVSFCPLSASPKVWANRILESKFSPRHEDQSLLVEAEYDLRSASRRLLDFYTDCLDVRDS